MKYYIPYIAIILAIVLIVIWGIIWNALQERYIQNCLDKGLVPLETMRGDVICVDVNKTL